MREVGRQLVEPRIPLLFSVVTARLPKLTRARAGFTRQAQRIAIGVGDPEPGVVAVAPVPDPGCHCRCAGSPRGGSLPMPYGPGLEIPGVPVTSGPLVGHGGLLVRIGSIKQELDRLVRGFRSSLTCAFGAPVQLRNPLLELVQVAPGEQSVSTGLHDLDMPADRRPGQGLIALPGWPKVPTAADDHDQCRRVRLATTAREVRP